MDTQSKTTTSPLVADALVIGGGIAGITAALELLDQRQSVILVDAEPETYFGGQANNAFGGMLLINTPEQRKNGVHDSPELLFRDWCRAAEFKEDDHWGRAWAHAYAYHCKTDIYDWLRGHGIRFFPAVQWVERGNFGQGNSRPRYHIAWGCGRGIVQTLIAKLREHPHRAHLRLMFEHRVTSLDIEQAHVVGCSGIAPNEAAFSIRAKATIVCSGGINGNLQKIREAWDSCYGQFPENILMGVSPAADGSLHDAVRNIQGNVVHLNYMWNYAAGIEHPTPEFPRHGLSLIPARSALWLNAKGERIGPLPMITGFDTHDLCKQTGAQPGQYTWQVMNWKIAAKELAVSGTDENPHFRDKKFLRVLWQTLRGNHDLIDWLTTHSNDVVTASTIAELANKMRAVAQDDLLDPTTLEQEIREFDENVRLGPALSNDDQLRKLAQLRQWRSDRLRTCKQQPIVDAKAGPLIAIRARIISRKSMGGIQTNLDSQVLTESGQPIPGLFAAGEAAGFGGGGISGIRSLEGTFLSNCIFNARRAVRSICLRGEKS